MLRSEFADVTALHGALWASVVDMLNRLGIVESLLDRSPDAVSGGELQRVAIVRALLPNPACLFVDEPTSRLDPITQHDTLAALRTSTAERDCAVLLVTHDQALAAKMAERHLALG